MLSSTLQCECTTIWYFSPINGYLGCFSLWVKLLWKFCTSLFVIIHFYFFWDKHLEAESLGWEVKVSFLLRQTPSLSFYTPWKNSELRSNVVKLAFWKYPSGSNIMETEEAGWGRRQRGCKRPFQSPVKIPDTWIVAEETMTEKFGRLTQ